MKLWKEYLEDTKTINLSSLDAKDDLNPKFWSNMALHPTILSRLMLIANDFFSDLVLIDEGVNIEDITITGSLANYNWSDYSDIDLHLLVDFTKIDENVDLVREFFHGKVFRWNNTHDIEILGHICALYRSFCPHIGHLHAQFGQLDV